MNYAVVFSRARHGIDAPHIAVEAHLGPGLPAFSIVGLPETAVKEARDRVRGALHTSLFQVPPQRITINLAPADLPKEGGRFDLPIALGILAASGQLPRSVLERHEFIGELGLGGDLRAVPGALTAARAAAEEGRAIVVPSANADEAALASRARVFGCDHLLAVTAFLLGRLTLEPSVARPSMQSSPPPPDLDDVRGQDAAKRALAIAAAGGHNLLFYGPPGTGKTMLATRLPALLPPLSEAEQLDVAALQSSLAPLRHWPLSRPFRAPHHTASAAALVGGGSLPQPGEISLAHGGVLFLDELPEFPRQVLEALREPLESGSIDISRARARVRYPARFQLVAAMNPCPCGHLGDSMRPCRCSPDQIQRYRNRLSGPLLDRIDLQVPVPRLPRGQLSQPPAAEFRADVLREQVLEARQRQLQRGTLNSQLSSRELDQSGILPREEQQWLEQATLRMGLSTRAYHRVLKLARTIADLAGQARIERRHLAEALQYRGLDRPLSESGPRPGGAGGRD